MMKFFKKNKIDLDYSYVTMSVSDAIATNAGSAFLNFLRNRDNTSGWMTTGSTDAAGTVLSTSYVNAQDIDNIILVGHNFKNYHIEYYDSGTASWKDFVPTIHPTASTDTTTLHTFTKVNTSQVRITITSTQVVNADKMLTQWIITQAIGTLQVQPEMVPTLSKTRKITKFLSGKSYIARTLQNYSIKVKMKSITIDADLVIFESLFSSPDPFLVWPCGGDVTQFSHIRQGYRLQDIFLMGPSNEYVPEYQDSRWLNGVNITLDLVEVT